MLPARRGRSRCACREAIAGSQTSGPETGGWCLARWDAEGRLLWELQHRGAIESGDVAPDGEGGVFVVGRAGLNWDPDRWGEGRGFLKSAGFLARVDAEGQLAWERRWGGEGTFAFGVTADGDGGAVVTGWTFDPLVDGEAPSGDQDTFVGRWDADGRSLWLRKVGMLGWDAGMAVVLGRDRVLRVAGDGYDAQSRGVQYVQAFDLDGVASWRTGWTAGGGPGASLRAAVACGEDAVCVTGWTFEKGNAPQTDVFVSKVSATGALEWDGRYGYRAGDAAERIDVSEP